MAYEFFGTNMLDAAKQDAFLDTYAYLSDIKSKWRDELNIYDLISTWPKGDADSLATFLEKCLTHEHPAVRSSGISNAAEVVTQTESSELIRIYEQGLADPSEEAQHAAKSIMHDIVHGQVYEELIYSIGLGGLQKIIALYRQTGFEEEQRTPREQI